MYNLYKRNRNDLRIEKTIYTFIKRIVTFSLKRSDIIFQKHIAEQLKVTLKTILISKCYYSPKRFFKDHCDMLDISNNLVNMYCLKKE